MEENIKEFCKQYKSFLADKGKENPLYKRTFYLCGHSDLIQQEKLCITFSINSPDFGLLLDEEDLEYLYQKYSKKLEAEMEANISSIKEQYVKLINVNE